MMFWLEDRGLRESKQVGLDGMSRTGWLNIEAAEVKLEVKIEVVRVEKWKQV